MHACSNQFFLQDFSHHWPGLRPPWFNDDHHVKIIHSTSIHPMKSPFDQTSAAYEPKGYCIISRILRHHGAASMRLPLLDAQATPIDSDRNALIFDFSDWTSVTAWICCICSVKTSWRMAILHGYGMISHNSRQMPRVSWKALLANSRQQEHHEAFDGGFWCLDLILGRAHFSFSCWALVDFISGSLFLWHPLAKSVKAHGLPLDWVGFQGPWIPDDLRPHLDKWGPPLGMPVPHVISGVLKARERNPGTLGTCGRPWVNSKSFFFVNGLFKIQPARSCTFDDWE